MSIDCAYCNDTTSKVIWSDGVTRVMYIDDEPFVGWCRVISHATRWSLPTFRRKSATA